MKIKSLNPLDKVREQMDQLGKQLYSYKLNADQDHAVVSYSKLEQSELKSKRLLKYQSSFSYSQVSSVCLQKGLISNHASKDANQTQNQQFLENACKNHNRLKHKIQGSLQNVHFRNDHIAEYNQVQSCTRLKKTIHVLKKSKSKDLEQ